MDPTATQDISQNRQSELIDIDITIVALATLFVGLRFFSRWKAGVYWGIDDYTLLLALGFIFGLMTIGLLMIHFGMGRHAAALTFDQQVSIGKCLLAFECVYVTTVAIVKISLLLMYRRAFAVRSLHIQAYILGGIVVAWAIAIILVCIFQCTPITKDWNPTIAGTCINLKDSFIGNAIPNVTTDVLILALPIRHVWKLVPSLSLRLQLSVVFLLGSFVIFTSIYRFTTLFQFDPTDMPWTLATACSWCIVECGSGIISVCLPTLGPLLQMLHCMPSHRGTLVKNNSDNSTSSYKSDPATSYARQRFTSISSDPDTFQHKMPDPTRGGSMEPLDRVSEQSEMMETVQTIMMADLGRGDLENGYNHPSEHCGTEPNAKRRGLRPREMSMGARSKRPVT